MKTNILKAAWFTPMLNGCWGLPTCVWSKPGEAKTSIARDLARQYGLPYVILSPGEMGEGAFGVIPVPDKSGVLRYPPPEWTLVVKGGGIVIVDELTCAPPALQPPLLGLVLDGRIGGTTLHKRCRRTALSNPAEYAANGLDLNPAQANRMGHIEWSSPSVEEHTEFMTRETSGHSGTDKAEFDALAEEERVLAAWGGAWAHAVGLETGFLKARPDLKNKCPLPSDPRASRAWPSDRSWEFATRALASARVHGLSEVETDDFVSAFIGEATYSEWKVWITMADLPDATKVLDGAIEFNFDPMKVDQSYATLNACLTLVVPANAEKREDRTAAFWKILTKLFNSGVNQDLIIVPGQKLCSKDVGLGASSTYPKVRAAYQPLGQQKPFIDLLKLSGLGKP